jgi:hypothetical protein
MCKRAPSFVGAILDTGSKQDKKELNEMDTKCMDQACMQHPFLQPCDSWCMQSLKVCKDRDRQTNGRCEVFGVNVHTVTPCQIS